ncbi:MAG TPA: preprotein translocase subunit SecG, partial [Myxococcales bacterium]
MGPVPGCGHDGQPWASAWTCALSPRRAEAGICALPHLNSVYHFRSSSSRWGGVRPGGLAREKAPCYSRSPMFAFIITLHIVVSVFLIFVILLQPGKGDAMAAFAGGGGGANTVFGGRGS